MHRDVIQCLTRLRADFSIRLRGIAICIDKDRLTINRINIYAPAHHSALGGWNNFYLVAERSIRAVVTILIHPFILRINNRFSLAENRSMKDQLCRHKLSLAYKSRPSKIRKCQTGIIYISVPPDDQWWSPNTAGALDAATADLGGVVRNIDMANHRKRQAVFWAVWRTPVTVWWGLAVVVSYLQLSF